MASKTKAKPLTTYRVIVVADGQETDSDCGLVEIGEDGSLQLYHTPHDEVPFMAFAAGHWAKYTIVDQDPEPK